MEIEILNLVANNANWIEFDYFMVPPLYGFGLINNAERQCMIFGGKDHEGNELKSIQNYNFDFLLEDQMEDDISCTDVDIEGFDCLEEEADL